MRKLTSYLGVTDTIGSSTTFFNFQHFPSADVAFPPSIGVAVVAMNADAVDDCQQHA